MTEQDAPLRRRLLGAALHAYRTGAGLTLDDAARILGCHRSKISRVEKGVRGCAPAEVVGLLTEFGASSQEREVLAALARPGAAPGRAAAGLRALSPDSQDYLSLETTAGQIRSYGALRIPELLQTTGYATALLETCPELPASVRGELAEMLLRRQQALDGRVRAPVTVIIGETALRQQIGGPAVMREQITRLIQATVPGSRVTVRVLPEASGAAAAVTAAASVTVLRIAGSRSGVAQLGGVQDAIYLAENQDVDRYDATLTRLEHAALLGPESARFLRQQAGRRAGTP